MRRSLLVATALIAALSGCGPTDTPAAGPAPAGSSAARSTAPTSAASPANNGGGASAGVTPQALCGMLSVAKAGQISGFAIDNARPSMSGDVSVCTYLAPVSGSDLAKFIVEYQPNGKTLYDFTKAKGAAVSGVGREAVYFTSSGELVVLLDAQATMHIYVMDIRMHHGDPKAGALAVAQQVVPQLPGA
jgi:hypothetical protein